jgi:hypothetical protein
VSYDLHLFRAEEGDPVGAYERLEETGEREPTPAEERELRSLAANLQAADPKLDLTEPGSGRFMLQLGYENERDVVIDITGGEITMSWSYGAADAAPALRAVERYLPVFDRHGLVAYDPQLERVYEPVRDRVDAAELHRHVRMRVFAGSDAARDDRRPWWRRLLDRG